MPICDFLEGFPAERAVRLGLSKMEKYLGPARDALEAEPMAALDGGSGLLFQANATFRHLLAGEGIPAVLLFGHAVSLCQSELLIELCKYKYIYMARPTYSSFPYAPHPTRPPLFSPAKHALFMPIPGP